MRWVLSFNKKNNKKFYLLCFSLIFFDSIGFIGTLLLGHIVDEGVIKQNIKVLAQFSLLAIAFMLVKTFAAYIIVQRLDNVGNNYERAIKEKCFNHFQSFDKETYQGLNRGETLTMMTRDTRTANRYISYFLKTVGKLVIGFIIALILCFYINVPLTLITLIPLPFITICSVFYSKKISGLYDDVRNDISESNTFVRDNIEGNKVVRAFAQEKYEINSMAKLSGKLRDKWINLNSKSYFYWSFIRFGSSLMGIIFALVGVIFLIKGEITIGDFVMMQGLLGSLSSPFIRLGELIDRKQEFNSSKKRISEFLKIEPKIKNTGTKKIDNLLCPISIKNVTIAFDDEIVIKNLNVQISPKETIAFIGPTGSGKSSIVNLLLGFVTPKEGEVLIDNKNIKECDLFSIRNKIGYVSQQPFLFSDTIFNNITYGKNLKIEEALEVAKRAKMDFIEKLPDGLNTIIGEKGVMLSGGEKQRLSLARALAVKPNILILDDITSALDIDTEKEITKEIYNLDFECTKVIIAQKIVSVRFADKIYVVDNNQIIESGTHEELLKNKGYYYQMYELQKDNLLEEVK